MPKKKKSSSAPKGLSAAETAQVNKQGFDHAMDRLPPITFDDMFSNFEMFSGGLGDMFGSVFGGLIDRGENTIGVADRNPTTATEQLTEAVNPQPAQPQMDPYEARIQELMQKRGWSRDVAIANQQNALGLGTDFNKDGAVTNDEWAKYKQTPGGAAYVARNPGQPQAPQPGAPQPGMPQPGMPPGVNLTPEQLAAIQKFNGYGQGVA